MSKIKAGKDAYDILASKIKGAQADALFDKAPDLVKDFVSGKINLSTVKGQLRDRIKKSIKKKKKSEGEAREAGYLKESDKKAADSKKRIMGFKKTGGSVKKKKVAKMNKGGMADYYKGMV